MTDQAFQQGMSRLASTFGKGAYSNERTALIWREVNTLADPAWIRIVDELIGDHRQAPLLPEIRELASRERVKVWEREKKQHASDAKGFMKGAFGDEDVRTLCGLVLDRITGRASENDWNGMMKAFQHAADYTISLCRTCRTDGLVFHRDENGYEWVYRCYCAAGEKQPRCYPVWRRA